MKKIEDEEKNLLEKFGLPRKFARALELHVKHPDELMNKEPRELLRIGRIGPKAVREIQDFLTQQGKSLKNFEHWDGKNTGPYQRKKTRIFGHFVAHGFKNF